MIWRKRRRPPTRSEETLPLPAALTRPGHPGVYLLKRSSARRTLALRVGDDGGVAVNAPLNLPQRDVDHFLLRHADWLGARLAQADGDGFHWRDGAGLPWRGGHLTLRLLPPGGRPAVRLAGDELLCAAEPVQIAPLVIRWYQTQARLLLAERLAHHAARMGRATPPLRLSDARTRWGSLSPRGVVSLNWRLVKACPEALDYVVCHELAHFRQRNHSPAFWAEVATLFPDYARVRAGLRAEGRRYFQF